MAKVLLILKCQIVIIFKELLFFNFVFMEYGEKIKFMTILRFLLN
jgi:hypothetical protein